MSHVEAARLVDPELDPVRHEAKAGPVRWASDRAVGKFRLELGEPALQLRWVAQRLALERRPGADLAAARARREVGVRFLVRHLLDAPLEPDLALERLPVEAHRGHG